MMFEPKPINMVANNSAAIAKIHRAIFIINMMNAKPQSMGLIARYNQSVREIQEAANELNLIAMGE